MTLIYKQPNLIAADPIRPLYNVGCGLDVPTGDYVKGLYDEMILNGGLAPLTGIAAKPNFFKTTLMQHFMLSVLASFNMAAANEYDTESTQTDQRLIDLARKHPGLLPETLFPEVNPRFILTNKDYHFGDEWFASWREFMSNKRKEKSKNLHRSPFPSRNGRDNMMILPPDVAGADSLTEFFTQAVAELGDQYDIADSKRNMTYMTNGRHKAAMISELGQFTSATNCPTILSAHIGTSFALDAFSPPEKVMQYMKQGTKILGVTGKFLYLTSNCWLIPNVTTFSTKDRFCELPLPGEAQLKDNNDLVDITVLNLRGKTGCTGVPMRIMGSQTEGILSSLTEFQSLRDNAYYGLVGGNQNYVNVFLPDVKLSRTTVRGKLDEIPALRRATKIASEMRQIERFHGRKYGDLLCTPEELFKSLKEKKYDWDQLLATRGEWTLDNDKQSIPYLSTLDLLRMRKELYKPYWM